MSTTLAPTTLTGGGDDDAQPVLLRELPWLLYHAFVTNNSSL